MISFKNTKTYTVVNYFITLVLTTLTLLLPPSQSEASDLGYMCKVGSDCISIQSYNSNIKGWRKMGYSQRCNDTNAKCAETYVLKKKSAPVQNSQNSLPMKSFVNPSKAEKRPSPQSPASPNPATPTKTGPAPEVVKAPDSSTPANYSNDQTMDAQKSQASNNTVEEKYKECANLSGYTDTTAIITNSNGSNSRSQVLSKFDECKADVDKRLREECKDATKKIEGEWDKFINSCTLLDTAINDKNESCFKRSFQCDQNIQMDLKSVSSYFTEQLLAINGVNSTKKTQNVNTAKYTCPQISGQTYSRRRDSIEKKTETLNSKKERIIKELADLKNEREEERIATEKKLKEAKQKYESDSKDIARSAEDETQSLEQESRVKLIQERQQLEAELMSANLMAQVAAQNLFNNAKLSSLLYKQSCSNRATSAVKNDKSLKGPDNAAMRKQIAMDIYTECINKIEGEMYSKNQEAQTSKMAAEKKIENTQQSLKLLDQKAQDIQNKLSQMKQRQSEDINKTLKSYNDQVAFLANEDKTNSTKNQNTTMQLMQELNQVNQDMEKEANKTAINEATKVSENEDQKENQTDLFTKIQNSFNNVNSYYEEYCPEETTPPAKPPTTLTYKCSEAKKACSVIKKGGYSKYHEKRTEAEKNAQSTK